MQRATVVLGGYDSCSFWVELRKGIVDFQRFMLYHEIMGAICHKDKGVCLLK